jgi:hypothetical protein
MKWWPFSNNVLKVIIRLLKEKFKYKITTILDKSRIIPANSIGTIHGSDRVCGKTHHFGTARV